jgi:hypothetical protein
MIHPLMEAFMSARVLIIATLLALSACGGPEIDPKAPQTAAARARLEAEEKGDEEGGRGRGRAGAGAGKWIKTTGPHPSAHKHIIFCKCAASCIDERQCCRDRDRKERKESKKEKKFQSQLKNVT